MGGRRPEEGQAALGKAIRSLREEAGLTQEELGKRSEISPSWICHIERGRIDPTWGNIRRIAGGLGVSVDRLAEEEAKIEGRAGWPGHFGLATATDVAIEFGRNVRRLRHRAGLSQRELAHRCGVHLSTIEKIEHGESLSKLDTVVKLASCLGTPPPVLFENLPYWFSYESGGGEFAMPEVREAA